MRAERAERAERAGRSGDHGRWRHVRRGLDAACDAAIMGGVLAMPFGGLATIIALMLPTGGLPHHCEGLIYGIAVLWFVAALVGAHLRGAPHSSDT